MNWLDEIEPGIPKRESKRDGASIPDTTNEWSALWDGMHPEGGGPFGGRDNALTVLVGFFRAKWFPLEAALEMAMAWNHNHCTPPLDDDAVADRVQRGWVEWMEGGLDDDTPESVSNPATRTLRFLDMDALAEEAAKAGQQEWLVPDLIMAGGVHYITAPPGGGKSWAAVDLVRAMTTGTEWLGFRKALKVPVLYINEEMGAGTFFSRLDDMGTGKDGFWTLQQSSVKLDNPEHLAQVVRFVAEKGIRVVILDTFVRTHKLDENSNTDMARVYDLFKEINATGAALVALHHHRKGGVSSPVAHEMMRGAGELAAQADLVAAIDKTDSGFVWRTTKHRHLEDSKWPKFGFRILTLDDGTKRIQHFEPEDAQEGAYVDRTGTLPDKTTQYPSGQVLSLICQNEGISSTELAKAMGKRRDTVDDWLARLEAEGSIRRHVSQNNRVSWFPASIF